MDHFTAAVDGKTSKQPPTGTSYDERQTKDIPEMRRTASGSTIRLVQEAEADKEERQRGEEERRRQKVEDKRRLDDAKLEEERRRKEEQRRKRLEQGPQQPVKPWLLPLIGAGAASLPVLVALLVFMLSDPVPMPKEDKIWGVISAVLCGLYGGAAGMLIPRFGILKAMAIPVIPGFLLIFATTAGLRPRLSDALFVALFWQGLAVIVAWLAFWLHSLATVRRSRAGAIT
jgi:hypothetical protein